MESQDQQGRAPAGQPEVPAKPDDGLKDPRQLLAWARSLFEVSPRWKKEEAALLHRRALEAMQPKNWRLKRTLWSGVGLFLSFFVIALLVDIVEPFGLDNATKAHSSRISARIMAPFYESRAQQHIAVVLIDQATLDSRGQAWPPRYDFYENVMRRVLRQSPRSVYFDILTSDLRPYDESLADARAALEEELADAQVPLLLGTISPYSRSVFQVVDGVSMSVAGWHGHGEDYPLILTADHFVLDNQPSQSNASAVSRADTVAYALYKQSCAGENPICADHAPVLDDGEAIEPMVVHWGAALPAVPQELVPRLGSCVVSGGAGPTGFQKLRHSISAAWYSFWSGSDPQVLDAHREKCPPVLTILEHQLDDPDIAELLTDRIVLVGTRLAALDDTVVSPVHQRIPGVYLHAMALDNLITWGNDRLHRRPVFSKAFGWISALALSVLIAWIVRDSAGLLRRALLLFVAMVWVLGGTVLLQIVFRQPPLDWLGSLALMLSLVGAYMATRPQEN